MVNILTYRPHQIFKKDVLTMEYSVNLASSLRKFTYHRQYYYMIDISFYGGGIQNIMV